MYKCEHYTDSIYYQLEQTAKYCKYLGMQIFQKLELPISLDEFVILDILIDNEEICQRDLAKLILKDRPCTGRLLNSLEEKGFIKRFVDTKNNRLVKKMKLTSAGIETTEKVTIIIKNYMDKLPKVLSDDNKLELINSIKKFRENLEKEVEMKIKEVTGMEEKNQNQPQEAQETKQPKKGIKRTIALVVVVIAFILAGVYLYNEMQYESTDDAYVETTTVNVSPKISGQIEEVFVKDNQFVHEGDLVAIIDSADYKIKLEQADSNYEKIKLDQSNAKANLTAAQSNIALAKKDLERYTKLYEQGAVSKQTLDAAQVKYDSAQANLTQANQALFSNKEGVTVADANLKNAKATKDKAALDLYYTKIYAPQSGTVSSRRVEKGMWVTAGSPLFTLVPENVWVVANFKENQLRGMKAGQPVDIKIDTYPNKVFKGKIDSIQRASGAKSSLFPPENAVGSFVKIVQRIPVKIVFTEKIDSNQYNIVPGMSVVPKVKVK